MNWDHSIRVSSKITFSCLPWENTISSTHCGFSVWNTWILPKRIFVSKAVWRCNLVKVLGQQPRYQCVASSVTMWQLFHREPSVSSWHHKLLTRQLLPTSWSEGGGVIDHRMRGVLQGKIQTTRVPFTIRDNEFKSNGGFDLKRFKCSTRTSTINRYNVLYYPITTGLLISGWQLLL